MVFSGLKVEILFSWLWMRRCAFAGIKKHGWYSVGRVRVSLVLKKSKPLEYHALGGQPFRIPSAGKFTIEKAKP